MIGVELALALTGVVITIMVVVGMVLIVPGGVESAPAHRADPIPPERSTPTGDLGDHHREEHRVGAP